MLPHRLPSQAWLPQCYTLELPYPPRHGIRQGQALHVARLACMSAHEESCCAAQRLTQVQGLGRRRIVIRPALEDYAQPSTYDEDPTNVPGLDLGLRGRSCLALTL